jgi:hypothetical protein
MGKTIVKGTGASIVERAARVARVARAVALGERPASFLKCRCRVNTLTRKVNCGIVPALWRHCTRIVEALYPHCGILFVVRCMSSEDAKTRKN